MEKQKVIHTVRSRDKKNVGEGDKDGQIDKW